MKNIILNEWKKKYRSTTFFYLNVFFILSLLIVVYLGIIQNNNQEKYRKIVQEEVRDQWNNLEPMNPHSAAHYGSYAFKPMNALNSLDGGINNITGNVIKLEGHVQNEILYSEASQSQSISKFGKLKSSLLLQFVIPLIIIFLAYDSIVNEKKSGRIKLLFLEGISIRKLIFSKAISVWLYGVVLLLLTIIFQTLNFVDFETAKRIVFLIFTYSIYYYIISVLVTYLSATMKNNTSVLSLIISIWIVWTIFTPKLWGNTVEKIHSLPSRQEFKANMKEERSKGIDGHNPYDVRREKLKNKFLNQYNVDSLSQLPINFDGIVMQADEEYGNQIWDKYFGNNYKIMQNQKKLFQLLGLVNPFSSLQSLSMGFAGTDMIHHFDFLKSSENYRRYFIKELNDKHAYGGSKTGDWKWTVDSLYFRSVDTFEYKSANILDKINYYYIDLFFLLGWFCFVNVIVSIYQGRENNGW